MLSNPTSNLQNRQRQHRRQNSTPTAFEPTKVNNNNLPHIQRHGHRRGMSLDQRRRQTPPQETQVSNTNQGYQTTPQHILQETQQQRLARPGQQYTTYGNDENYLNSPIVTPQRQSFDAGYANLYEANGHHSSYSYPGPINTIIPIDPNTFSGNDYDLFSADTALTPTFMNFFADTDMSCQSPNDGNHSRRSSNGRRISGGILDRVSQFENLALKSPARPLTPPNQNASNYLPPTPMYTPSNNVKQEEINRRFLDSYDTSMEETIKPKNNQRARAVFDDMRKEAEMKAVSSPSRTDPMPTPNTFDSAPMPTSNFMNMNNINLDFLKNERTYESQYSPTSTNVSTDLSYCSSPDVAHMASFSDPFTNQPHLEASQSSYPPPAVYHDGLPMGPIGSPAPSLHRRSESVTSINLDESINDTGVTIDDIATFISGPDPVTNRWLCLYPECKKLFGRKENIKSHVQTHLGDRQFQCPHCHKCFVRQHDLKRHAKIHSGVKPYPCQCGNSFARHDALTRHRQRGMCIGAFEGVVKKTVKRGRPRKHRPDNEERVSKSNRVRSKNKAPSSASSTSGYSESASAHSPRDELDVLNDKPFEYDYSQNSAVTNDFQYSQPQSPPPPECVSPQAIQARSPSAYSTHSTNSEHLPSHPASPTKSIHSYHSPPGLCDSSSSPAAAHYYDLDTQSTGLANISEHDDEMFMEAFAAAAGTDMTQLDQDPDLLMGKFEDVFGTGVEGQDMFKGEADLFFGSP